MNSVVSLLDIVQAYPCTLCSSDTSLHANICVQESYHTKQQLQQILCHYITLTRPNQYGTAAYDDFAEQLIQALLVRLSVLPNMKKESVKVFVSDLTQKGEIIIKVVGVAVPTESAAPEGTRQAFLLAIHNVYHTLLEKEEGVAEAQTFEEVSLGVQL